jgi:hypothetical protein
VDQDLPEAESTDDLVVDEYFGKCIDCRNLHGVHTGRGPDFWLGKPEGAELEAEPHWTEVLAEGRPDYLVDPSVGRSSLPQVVCVRLRSLARMYRLRPRSQHRLN